MRREPFPAFPRILEGSCGILEGFFRFFLLRDVRLGFWSFFSGFLKDSWTLNRFSMLKDSWEILRGFLEDSWRILGGFLEDSLTGDAHCLIRGCGSLFEWQRFLEDSSDIGRDHVETGEDSFRIPGDS